LIGAIRAGPFAVALSDSDGGAVLVTGTRGDLELPIVKKSSSESSSESFLMALVRRDGAGIVVCLTIEMGVAAD
jgi:hypothetical protein